MAAATNIIGLPLQFNRDNRALNKKAYLTTTDTQSSSTFRQFESNGAMDKAPSSLLSITHDNRLTLPNRTFNPSSARANCFK